MSQLPVPVAPRPVQGDYTDYTEGGAYGPPIVPLRRRDDGWTPGRQHDFLVELGKTGCVSDACAAVDMSTTSAYRLRARSSDFAHAWAQARAMAATVLEQTAFERAVTGTLEPVWYHGKVVGQRRRYSDSLLRLLLQRQDQAERSAAGNGSPDGKRKRWQRRRLSDEEVRTEFLRRLEVWDEQEQKRKIREADAWRERGLVP